MASPLIPDSILDMGSEFHECVRLGSNVRIKIDLHKSGYLLLLNKGTTGRVYCLCPSGYANQPNVSLGSVVLPQKDSLRTSFKITGNSGLEQLLAIVWGHQPTLNWLAQVDKAPWLLTTENLEELLQCLRQNANQDAFYTEFTIIV